MKSVRTSSVTFSAAKVVCAVSILLFFLFPRTGESDPDGKALFAQGRKDLEALRYDAAVSNLSRARGTFPLLEDYTLYDLAQAYHGLGDHRQSLETAQALLAGFSSTPLRKKARMLEIQETKETGGNDVLSLYEAYSKEFRDDDETLFQYGKLLREAGNIEKATSVFKKIYVGAGSLSQAALSELTVQDIERKDIIERASNLVNSYHYTEAERELRHELGKDDDAMRRELLSLLGTSLFRQKKYREAAEVFGNANDRYSRARSLYRAGDRDAFEEALGTLISSDDRRAGFLLNALAADKRREKDFEGAIRIYRDVLRNYASDAEDALWGIGWTQYRSGDYEKSAATFSQLYETYDDLKYRYWQARSLEAGGNTAAELYPKLMRAENSFYAVLTYAMNRTPLIKPASLKSPAGDMLHERTKRSDRIEALLSLGMRKEAVSELSFASRKIDTPTDLLYIISKFQEIGEFKRSISLASQMPYSEKMHAFWYPLAFWDTVERAAKKWNIDPLVILSVMREESRFDPDARSVAGAYGLMQLMPRTAYRLDRSLGLGIDRPSQLTLVRENIELGSLYLRDLFQEFHSLPHVLAAYNAGEQAVRAWQDRGDYRSVDEFIEDIPYAETRNYVKKVLTSYFQYKKLSSVDREGTVFDIISGRR